MWLEKGDCYKGTIMHRLLMCQCKTAAVSAWHSSSRDQKGLLLHVDPLTVLARWLRLLCVLSGGTAAVSTALS